jgi:hypothetical protein
MRLIQSAIAAIFTVSVFGCSIPDGTAQRNAELRACNLQDDPSITQDVDIRACHPGQTKKTTICHIPPGNPANAHTICVGNDAVPAHVENHQDTIGQCPNERPCDGGDVDAGVSIDSGGGSGADGGVIIL